MEEDILRGHDKKLRILLLTQPKKKKKIHSGQKPKYITSLAKANVGYKSQNNWI